MDEIRLTAVIPATHPCFAGHFPGNPIVPGVVLLDEVQAAARRVWGLSAPTALPNVKFLASVLPDQSFEMVLTRTGLDSYSFRIEVQEKSVAQGTMKTGIR